MVFLLLALAASAARAAVYPVTPDMRTGASQIIATLLPSTGVTPQSSFIWQRLSYITDTFGPRLSGSAALESALDWVKATATADGLTVTEIEAWVPTWVRGNESAWMISPRRKKLHFAGLGMSNGTDGQDVTAQVFVVFGASPAAALASLQANCSFAAGKIVLFNVPFTTYGDTVPVRGAAAQWAYACGAVAALVRTIGPYSLQNPHTGAAATAPIPSGAVSLEDASQMQRMQDRGQQIIVTLNMQAKQYNDSLSRNLLIDILGATKPDEVVMVGGHMDSWDLAEGAMDDGGGAVTSWEAVRTIYNLVQAGAIPQPARTIRAVMWVNEENGDRGGEAYAAALQGGGYQGLDKHSFALETDIGAFQPYGIGVSCLPTADCSAAMAQMTLIGAELLAGIGSGNVSAGGGGTDVEPSCNAGVPCMGTNVLDPRLTGDSNNPCMNDAMGAWTAPTFSPSNMPYDSQYFWIHHSEGEYPSWRDGGPSLLLFLRARTPLSRCLFLTPPSPCALLTRNNPHRTQLTQWREWTPGSSTTTLPPLQCGPML
jgi:carboxypeptidase Q